MDETTTAPTTSGRADSGGRRVEKMGGAVKKNGPRKTSTPKKKPKQVRLPFDGGSSDVPSVGREPYK